MEDTSSRSVLSIVRRSLASESFEREQMAIIRQCSNQNLMAMASVEEVPDAAPATTDSSSTTTQQAPSNEEVASLSLRGEENTPEMEREEAIGMAIDDSCKSNGTDVVDLLVRAGSIRTLQVSPNDLSEASTQDDATQEDASEETHEEREQRNQDELLKDIENHYQQQDANRHYEDAGRRKLEEVGQEAVVAEKPDGKAAASEEKPDDKAAPESLLKTEAPLCPPSGQSVKRLTTDAGAPPPDPIARGRCLVGETHLIGAIAVAGHVTGDASSDVDSHSNASLGNRSTDMEAPPTRPRLELTRTLSHATLIEDESVYDVHDVEAQPFDEDAAQSRRVKAKQERHCFLGGVGLTFLLALAVVLILMKAIAPDWISSRPHESVPSAAPTTFSAESYVLSLLPEYTVDSIEDDRESPQARAYRWILDDPSVATYSAERIVQRFALGTLFYATTGAEWGTNTDWMSYEVHECGWHAQNVVTIFKDLGVAVPEVVYRVSDPLLKDKSFPCEDPVVEQQYSHLWLPFNNLQGHIPLELYLLTSLRSIVVGPNGLTGTHIPSDIGRLSSLVLLQYAHSGFSGTIPTEIGLLSRLDALFLAQGGISGTIPTEIGLLSDNLKILDLGENQLSGTFPTFLGSFKEMKVLLPYGNSLSGTIPTQLAMLRQVEYMALGPNRLEGTIPSELGLLKDITKLWLEVNSLTGPIPTELAMLQNVETLMLFSNQLSGTIPTELGLLNQTKAMALGSNLLVGSIPNELGMLQDVQGLYFENNRLTGSVPWTIANLVTSGSLEVLHIYTNNFEGVLQDDLCLIETISDFNSQLTGCNCTCSFELPHESVLDYFYQPGLKVCSPLPTHCA